MNYKEIKKGQLDLYTIFIASRHFTTIEDFINLEMSCSRYFGNMTKFHYNPIPLTPITREFFDHLQTLYVYSLDDNLFLDDKRIIKREFQQCYYKISSSYLYQIQQWTTMNLNQILFDSSSFDLDNSLEKKEYHLDTLLLDKQHLLFLIETKEKNDSNKLITFGAVIHSTINQINEWISDSNAFVFTFKNNLKGNKYKIKQENQHHAFYLYSHSNPLQFLFKIGFADIRLLQHSCKSSILQDIDSSFDYTNDFCLLDRCGLGCFQYHRLLIVQLN